MRAIVRAILASLMPSLLLAAVVGRPPIAYARSAAMQVVWDARAPRQLTPGSSFQVLVRGLRTPPAGGYCLGMASLRDRYGIPVTLGALRQSAGGQFAAHATIPSAVFPAEPPGPFLLFVGQCTSVAPEGLYAGMRITILPVAHTAR